MANVHDQAWISSAMTAESVEQAIVLGRSLRRCCTRRRLVVLVSESVHKDFRQYLNSIFDLVLPVDAVGDQEEQASGDMQAKLYATSLTLFRKFIFLSGNTLTLQYPDFLFELKFEDLEKTEITAASFIFSDKGMRELPSKYIIQYSLSTGDLQNFSFDGIFVDFTDGTVNETAILERITEDEKAAEKFTCQKWMDLKNELSSASPKASTSSSSGLSEPVAVIGMGCRLPGANNLQEFWNLLSNGLDATSCVPSCRWTPDQGVPYLTEKHMKTRAGFLSVPIDLFDPWFFEMNVLDAKYLDPQARVLYEVVWEALENAGVNPLTLRGTQTGVFTGTWTMDYRNYVDKGKESDFFRSYMGNSIGTINAKLSNFLGINGPSIATESACTSGMVSVRDAILSLQRGHADICIAGGVNLLLSAYSHELMPDVLSPTGSCKTFDKSADGYARAEGCGIVILKKLSDALKHRDNIWAVVRGTGFAQDGEAPEVCTLTAEGETLSMVRALEDAKINPDQVDFVECHGAGTNSGDVMEIEAMTRAYGSKNRKTPLIIASVKTNLGNTESASGVTGLIKTILSMTHELIPKHLNFTKVNPAINLKAIPAQIPVEPVAWPKNENGVSRKAGLSCFGISGSEVHMILEEPNPEVKYPRIDLCLERPLHFFKISAQSKEALEILHESYCKFFEDRKNSGDFVNAAYTANVGRADFSYREFILATDFQDAAKKMQSKNYRYAEVQTNWKKEVRTLCFLSGGQYSQYPGMARQLYETSPVFHVHFDRCCHILQKEYGLSLKPVILDENSKELNRTIYSQASIFVVEYCVLKLWENWGIYPDVVLGHGVGEFCAAVAAGVLSLEDALKLVASCSKLIKELPSGSMLVVKTDLQTTQKLLQDNSFRLDIAADNSQKETVVSGDTEEIKRLEELCNFTKIETALLSSSHAFHSSHMDAIYDKYKKVTETITHQTPNRPVEFVSSVTGRLMKPYHFHPNYWATHARSSVNFTKACTTLEKLCVTDYLEIGPQPLLSSLVLQNSETPELTIFPSLRKNTDDWNVMLNSLGELYLLGYPTNWEEFDAAYQRQKVSYLPTHPFIRKRHWLEKYTPVQRHPLAGKEQKMARGPFIFKNNLNLGIAYYLKDHCVGNHIIFPAAGFMELALATGKEKLDAYRRKYNTPHMDGVLILKNTAYEAPLELFEKRSTKIHVTLKKVEYQWKSHAHNVQVLSLGNPEEKNNPLKMAWILHATTKLLIEPKEENKWRNVDHSAFITQMIKNPEFRSPETFYKKIDKAGLKFGPYFQSIQRAWILEGEDESFTQVKCPIFVGNYVVNPVLLDAALQSCIWREVEEDPEGDTYVLIPEHTLRLEVFLERKIEGEMFYVHTWKKDGLHYFNLFSADKQLLVGMEGTSVVKTVVSKVEDMLEKSSKRMRNHWQEFAKGWIKQLETNIYKEKKILTEEEKQLELDKVRLFKRKNRYKDNV